MRAVRCAAAAALVLGCVPASVGAPQTGATLMVVEATDPPLIRVYAADELPERLVLTRSADAEAYYLWYDRSPTELALLPDAHHEIVAAPESAADREVWSLPTPDRWTSALGVTGERTLPPPLRGLRIPRPPCPTFAVEGSTISGRLEASFLLPLGDEDRGGVVVGSTVRYDAPDEPRINHPTQLYYFEPGAPIEALVTYAAPALLADMVDPAGWAADGQVYALISTFPGEVRTPIQQLYAITATRGVARVANYPREVTRRFVSMARAEDGAVWATTASAALGTFEPRTGAWTPRVEATVDRSLGCPISTQHGVLELAGPGRGLVGFTRGPLGTFDAEAGDGLRPIARELVAAACRSAHVSLDGGGELIALLRDVAIGSGAVGVVAWRPTPDESFRPLELDLRTNGAAVAAIGDIALVSLQALVGGGRSIAVVDLDRRRPDAAPRECPPISVPIDVRHMLWRGDRLAVTGARGHGVAWVRLIDRP